jgi:CHRD domain-containing protein
MRKLWWTAALGALVLVFGIVAVATAGGGGGRHGSKAHLDGYQEVPPISTAANGRFKAKINGSQIDYKLSYSGFDTPVKFAHIHFGQLGVEGGVSAFLCGGGSKPACPQSGEVTGTIAASDVIGPADQGIAAGEIDELIAAMRHGATYANVHTNAYPDGEIRGQIGGRGGHGEFGQKDKHGKFGQGDFGHGGSRHGGHDHGGNDD